MSTNTILAAIHSVIKGTFLFMLPNDWTTIEKFAYVYGIICIIILFINISFYAWLFINRKSWMIDTKDILEGMMNMKTNKTPEKKNTPKPAVNDIDHNDMPPAEDQKKEVKSEPIFDADNENKKDDIASLTLHVGDQYMCIPAINSDEYQGSDYTWILTNEFIGEINQETAILKAKKAGTAYIIRSNKKLYHITIEPKNTEWIGYLLLKNLLDKTKIDSVKSSLKTNVAFTENTDRKILRITAADSSYTIIYKWNKYGVITSGVAMIQDSDETRKMITANMSELMDEITTSNKSEALKYWVHISGEETDSFAGAVDFVGFSKKSHTGVLLLGIGECWRAGATTDEIKINSDMLLQSFKDLLDNEDIPKQIGTKINRKKLKSKAKETTETMEDELKNSNISNGSENTTTPIQESNNNEENGSTAPVINDSEDEPEDNEPENNYDEDEFNGEPEINEEGYYPEE